VTLKVFPPRETVEPVLHNSAAAMATEYQRLSIMACELVSVGLVCRQRLPGVLLYWAWIRTTAWMNYHRGLIQGCKWRRMCRIMQGYRSKNLWDALRGGEIASRSAIDGVWVLRAGNGKSVTVPPLLVCMLYATHAVHAYTGNGTCVKPRVAKKIIDLSL